ncbi:MAG TPA: four helix bundle protein [Gemmatimonadaceae bacterium]|nr:four helix bundle protein [Gemmatimonadaceae bacterium]
MEHDGLRTPPSKAINSYRDLRVWHHAVELFAAVTALIRPLPVAERLIFETQTRRAARGVAASIAEGCCRWDLGDYARSVSYASGSLGEVETDLRLIALVNDVDQDQLRRCLELCDTAGRELNRLTHSLRRLRKRDKQS